MPPDSLRQTLSEFLTGARAAVVIEDGVIAFDLAESKYSISGEDTKCLLHLWSSERNVVRRVLDAEEKSATLRLQVQRMGQTRPTRLDFCRNRDQRSPAAKRVARVAYQPRLRRTLERNFSGWTVGHLTTAMDLHRSFGPAYLRGSLHHGQHALAVVAVNDQKKQATIDGALTIGILLLEACRLAQQEWRLVEGLVMILPKGAATLTRQRMARLHPNAAKWQLCEIDQREDAFIPVALGDRGNLATRLVHAVDEMQARDRLAESITLIRGILPQSEVVVLSPALVSFRCYGLEFARAEIAHDPEYFQSRQKIAFGLDAEERALGAENEDHFADLVRLAAAIRHKDGPKNHALWRMCP